MSHRGCDADNLEIETVVISTPLKAGEDVLIGGSRLESYQGNAHHIIIFGRHQKKTDVLRMPVIESCGFNMINGRMLHVDIFIELKQALQNLTHKKLISGTRVYAWIYLSALVWFRS